MIHHKKTNRPTTDLLSPRDTVMHNTSIQDYPHDDDDFEDEYLVKLKQENEIMMKKFDE